MTSNISVEYLSAVLGEIHNISFSYVEFIIPVTNLKLLNVGSCFPLLAVWCYCILYTGPSQSMANPRFHHKIAVWLHHI